MNKIIKILCSLVIFVLSFTAGCAQKGDSPKEDDTKKVPNVIALNSFENTKQFDTALLKGILGKVELNRDKAFVKDGEKSGKVTVIHNPYTPQIPMLFQSFYLGDKEHDYTDFSHIGLFSMQVYNANAKKEKISLQLVFGSMAGEIVYYELEPDCWTDIKYKIEREYIPKTMTDKGEEKLLVDGVSITFDRPKTSDRIFYVDDLKLMRNKSGYQPYSMILDENEICSFDKIWQSKTMITEKGNYLLSAPSVRADSSNTATGKGKSLKVIAFAGNNDYDTAPPSDKHWPGVGLNTEMTKLVDFAGYPQTARFCFDAYSPVENGVDVIWMSLYGDWKPGSNGLNRFFSGPGEVLPRGQWTTISYTVAQLNSTSEWSEDYNFSKTGYIAIRWGEHTGPDRILYLDNFRMEI